MNYLVLIQVTDFIDIDAAEEKHFYKLVLFSLSNLDKTLKTVASIKVQMCFKSQP